MNKIPGKRGRPKGYSPISSLRISEEKKGIDKMETEDKDLAQEVGALSPAPKSALREVTDEQRKELFYKRLRGASNVGQFRGNALPMPEDGSIDEELFHYHFSTEKDRETCYNEVDPLTGFWTDHICKNGKRWEITRGKGANGNKEHFVLVRIERDLWEEKQKRKSDIHTQRDGSNRDVGVHREFDGGSSAGFRPYDDRYS